MGIRWMATLEDERGSPMETLRRSGSGRDRAGRPGFTLVELLIVILIIGLMIALLVPAVSGAWETAQLAQCKSNLNKIYTAQGLWRADRNSVQLVSGQAWASRLLPYLEGQTKVFLCPAAPLRGDPGSSNNPSGGSGSGGGSGGSSSGGSEHTEVSMEFDIYWQQGYKPSQPDYMPNTGIRGPLAYTIPLESHPWVRRTTVGNSILYEVDDEGSTGGAGNPITYDDIKFQVYYEDGQPVRYQILKASCTGSPYQKYIYDFKINGKVVVSEWVQHIGETLPVDDGSDDGGAILGDYGLSRGIYESPAGSVQTLDAKQFFILDYPKSLANYSGIEQDPWHKYFITQGPDEWDQVFGGPSVGSWDEYQALRHGGRANVLFSDGHIDTLGPEDLEETNPRWWHSGR